MTALTFEAALSAADGKKHLLLGNGFSIALKPDIFTYGSLYENANFTGVPYAREIFDALQTKDFEIIIKLLNDMAKIISIYQDGDLAVAQRLRQDAAAIKTILVDTIASRHPDRPHQITPHQYAACREFLKNFDHYYTLNYDVLLYWTLMQDEVDEWKPNHDDGFRAPEDNLDAPYVSWQSHNSSTVHYLHGALHLFDAGSEITKYTWARTDIPIIDQIRQALDQEKYPIFVSAGSSASKQKRILHNAYLHKALRSLGSITGSVFVFGHSLDDNDRHIFKEIVKNTRIKALYVSLYGDSDSVANSAIKRKSELLATERAGHAPTRPLSVSFYSAESAQVWG
jgi:hypothetical protein